MNCRNKIIFTALFISSLSLSPTDALSKADHDGARWFPAPWRNYTLNRSSPITEIVIHTIEDGHYKKSKHSGSFQSAVNTFRNPSSEVSAHYVVSKEGEIVQLVLEKNTAHHIRTRELKAFTIGIEHEGHAGSPYMTDAMLIASARLVKDIAIRHGIPRDRGHIRGHSEYPRPKYSVPKKMYDPGGPDGKFWPWERYIRYIKDDTPPKIFIKKISKASAAVLKIEVDDGGTGSGIDRLEVWQDNNGIKNKLFSDDTYRDAKHEYEVTNVPPGKILIKAYDLMGNFKSMTFTIR